MSGRSLRTSVKRLYKHLIFAGKTYDLPGLEKVRAQAKREFMEHKDEADPEKIKDLIARGRWYLREIEALNRLHQYRTLKKRYYD